MTGEKNKKILIVDDEPDVVIYLRALLEDNDFITITAENGREGVEKAISEKPHLITLDMSMPDESGVRAFNKLRENKATTDIPIIIVTGISAEFKESIESRMKVHRPKAYFEKPIDRDEFLSKVKEILNISDN
ncbi:MAG: response regulator [Candidatus Hatepunaea meridiana]|nr:response regulator [Candidatus Hatepunaea meridiana]